MRDFPLSFHAQAKPAALATHCARDQGQFWNMHHAVFENQRRLAPDLYETLAGTLGLDVAEFASCLQEPEKSAVIDESVVKVEENHHCSDASCRAAIFLRICTDAIRCPARNLLPARILHQRLAHE